MKVLLCAVVLLASAAPARAELSLNAVYAAATVSETEKPGFSEWSSRLDAAKRRRSASKRLMLIGGGVMVVSTVLGTMAASGDSIDNSSYTVMYLGDVAGFATVCYGLLQSHSAGNDLDDLDREGRMKGYLALTPSRDGGVRVGLTLRF